jgi:uncharacterized protein (TIGR02594 family)
MTRFIKATYHADLQVAEFVTDDGRHLLRSGGTLPWRINNCGDLVSPVVDGVPAPKKTKNYIGFAKVPRQSGGEYHFFIFPDYETGRTELCASLKRKHGERTIPELVPKYAPSSDNDTDRYTRQLLQETGLAADKKVSAMTDGELTSLANGIQKLEGYENNADTRKEVWVPVSRINATDGARPIADAELTLQSGGKRQTIKSNHVGQFPPVPHADGPIQVLHKGANGELKQVGEISGDKGQVFNLELMVERFFGFSRPDQPPATPATAKRREPLSYQVRPGDTLSSIAAKFHTSTARIQHDNGLKTDKIFAGQILGINSAAEGPKRVTKTALKPAASSAPSKAPPAPKKPPEATTNAKSVRSQDGEGKPLAVVPVDGRQAPWMAFAVAEAKRLAGKTEDVIEKEGTNYHTAIHDDMRTMVGDNNAWCAAFANWCLMQAGYPIDTRRWREAARGFYSHDETDGKGHYIQNPLYAPLKTPIFGAIAVVVGKKSDHGHHVGFVYSRPDEKHVILLGGNQSNRVMFTLYQIEGTKDRLRFFVPVSYSSQAEKEQPVTLGGPSAHELNKAFGISDSQAREGQDR